MVSCSRLGHLMLLGPGHELLRVAVAAGESPELGQAGAWAAGRYQSKAACGYSMDQLLPVHSPAYL